MRCGGLGGNSAAPLVSPAGALEDYPGLRKSACGVFLFETEGRGGGAFSWHIVGPQGHRLHPLPFLHSPFPFPFCPGVCCWGRERACWPFSVTSHHHSPTIPSLPFSLLPSTYRQHFPSHILPPSQPSLRSFLPSRSLFSLRCFNPPCVPCVPTSSPPFPCFPQVLRPAPGPPRPRPLRR